jgi:hypothetical protein
MAFDPGGTTGWALLSFPETNLYHGHIFEGLEFDCGQFDGSEKRQSAGIALMLGEYKGPVVIEDFILRQYRKDPELLSPVRMTSRIENTIEWMERAEPRREPIHVFKQQPALAMSTATDGRMKKWGLWTPGQPHANDAVRHAITFIRRARGSRKLRTAAWGLAA